MSNYPNPKSQITNDIKTELHDQIDESHYSIVYNRHKKEWKNIPAETRILQARKSLEKYSMSYNKIRGLSMLDRKFRLIPIERSPNPITEIRILNVDLSFPLNTSFVTKRDYLFYPYYNGIYFKKVEKIVYNKYKQKFKYFFEEKYPGNETKDQQNMQYFVEWLLSMGNKFCYELAQIVQYYVDSRAQTSSTQATQTKFKIIKELKLTEFQVKNMKFNKKTWLSKTPDDVWSKINCNPWLKRIDSTDFTTKNTTLRSIEINQKYIDVTGSKPTIYDLHNLSNNPQAKIVSQNWLELFCSIQNSIRQGLTKFGLKKKDFMLLDSKGEFIPGYDATVYVDSWIKNGILWTSSLFALTLDCSSVEGSSLKKTLA